MLGISSNGIAPKLIVGIDGIKRMEGIELRGISYSAPFFHLEKDCGLVAELSVSKTGSVGGAI